jgi:hypothetical protein
MNVATFENLVYNYARAHGVPYISRSEQADFREFVSRKVRHFVEQTRCLYDDGVTFTLTSADDGTYDLLDEEVFSRAVLEPRIVLISTSASSGFSPLLDNDSLPGLCSLADADDWGFDYRNVADAQPQKAMLFPPQTLRLTPAPNTTYYGVISGWVQHIDLTAAAITDETDMELPETVLDACAHFCAGELILVGAEGPSVAAAIALANRGLELGSRYAAKASSMLLGDSARRSRRSPRYFLT